MFNQQFRNLTNLRTKNSGRGVCRRTRILAGLAALVFAGMFATGCRNGTKEPVTNATVAAGGIEARPLRDPAATGVGFHRLETEETGLDASNELRPENMRKYLLNGAGLATGDFDRDGLVDVFVVSQDGPNRLYRQTDSWKFEDVTAEAGNLDGGDRWGTGSLFADLNNDGWLDLYVCNINGPNQLFINQQDGKFLEEAEKRNAAFPGATTMASVADYDRDGDLDVYLVNNRIFSIMEESPDVKLRKVGDTMEVHPDFQEQYFLLEGRIQEAGQADRLLRNDGRGNFQDVTGEAGIAGFDMGLSATWWDYDGDGWIDLYVANDLKCPDHLYRNLGNGKFQDVIADMAGHTPWFSMGADAADINNDGRLDLLVADMSSTTHYKQKTTMGEMGNSAWFLTVGRPRQFMRNALYVNSGGERFYEAANLTGLDSTDWSWAIKFADFDNDSRVDLFVTNGVGRNMNDSDMGGQFRKLLEAGKTQAAEDQILDMPPLEEANLAFRNLGDLEFENVSAKWGVDFVGVSQGASVADIDRDGDLDLLVNNMNAPLGVYRNDIPDGNRVLIQLVGTTSNRDGIDARVTIDAGGQSQVRQLTLARGYMSGDEPLVHFGLGDAAMIERIVVEWPSGICQQFNMIAANQFLTITEGTKGQVEPHRESTPQPWMEEVAADSSGLDFRHSEIVLDDFEYQPLLPNKLSQLGPGMAWGDVNGDRRVDCYVGNAAGVFPGLFLQNDSGTFDAVDASFAESKYEDMGAVFFDVDADDDLDLYVASGGYGKEADSEYLADRLYLNDGAGKFHRAPDDGMPNIKASTSCVAAADYDRDGDLDLFVGTRLVSRRWPLAVSSYLLENRDGLLVDVTAERAIPLRDVGLVTGGVWTDVDDDGWVDLVVSLEWGPLLCLHNHEGKLVDPGEASGLAPYRGWWNSVAAGDLDNDGDIDLVACNTGLNTKYHASPDQPVQLYARDFDENGTLDLVETEWEGERCFPVRGKSCSSSAMPFLNEKFSTYHEFALADVTEIYSESALEAASHFSVTHLESMVFLNDGSGQFTPRALPRVAQISPGFGVVIEDLNGDGNADICLAQNFLHPQPETGQMDGGLGLVLAGDGTGSFRALGPVESGVCVEGQGMSLAAADIDGDRAPDLIMAINDEPLRVWRNRCATDRRRISIELAGLRGNQSGIGSRVALATRSGGRRDYEVRAGSGYLTQGPAMILATSDPNDPVNRIDVRWPDGSSQSREVTPDEQTITIERHQTAAQ